MWRLVAMVMLVPELVQAAELRVLLAGEVPAWLAGAHAAGALGTWGVETP